MTPTNSAAVAPSTSAAPNQRFQMADRLLAHENTTDASRLNEAAATIAVPMLGNITAAFSG